ncbi:MAG: 3-deoxy-D-manno-octulosonic acid transferase [Gammaproteobacteria bacterium]|nr:3-deoxy-D-manno-octulosonic acid transferase [Gammaproteobacteria bacterium]MDH5801762.1 3-deoxy-D-manno-octulosonic acid transferase [Gammaproteobacteria bacterium]
MNNTNPHPPRQYALILSVAWIPVLLLSLWQSLRHKQLRFLLQRFAIQIPKQSVHPVWVHAASVGEVMAAIPLVQQLQKESPQIPIVVTTITPTGANIVQHRLSGVQHVYLPLDTRGNVCTFLQRIRPLCALIMETELWPQLYSQCRQQQVPLLCINARLSDRTMNTKAWVRKLYAYTVRNVSAILAKSQQDAENFLQLGADPAVIQVIGNIKFAAVPQTQDAQPLLQVPYVLAASTHANEEELIAKAWLKRNLPQILVIAPRHPHRRDSILKQLSVLTSHIAVRSRGDTIKNDTRIYLADTLGELQSFMAFAQVVFMGGSLVPVGGHNILEPAQLAKAILFGPYMHNFDEESTLLLEQLAAVQVEDAEELLQQLEVLLRSEPKCQTLGERAQILVRQQQQVLQRYMEQIRPYCIPRQD